MHNRTGAEIRAIHEALKTEPVAVILLFQSHCDWTGSTKQHVQALARQYDFPLVTLNCDHLSPEMAGLAIPSVTVFRYGLQTSPPLRGARRLDVLQAFLIEHGVINVPDPASS